MESVPSPHLSWRIYIIYLDLVNKEYLSLFLHSAINLIIDPYQNKLMVIYFIPLVIIKYHSVYFVAYIFPHLVIGSYGDCLSIPLIYSNNHWVFVFIYGAFECSGFIMCIFCHSSRISHFSKKVWFILLRTTVEIKTYVLGVLIATRVSLPGRTRKCIYK